MIRTPTQLLAIAGLGFVLATGHTLFRSIVLDKPPIALSRQARPAPDPAPPTGLDPETAADPGADGTPPPADPTPSDAEDPQPEDPSADRTAAAPTGPLDAPVKEGSITLREAFELFEQGAFFLDARYEEDFDKGRIEGAIWMPASRVVTSEGQGDLNFIPPGGVVIIYCTGGDCDASENTAIRIEQLQYDFDIRILGMGYEDWANAGLPVEGAEVSP